MGAAWMGLLGLLVGSFLSVVVVRLPRMLARQWGEAPSPTQRPLPKRYNLALPASHAPCCGQALRWHHNLPVISYLLLRGRCGFCGVRIGLMYPALELCTALAFAVCGWRFGAGITALCWAGLCAALLALAWIDWQTTLLPDDITLPLLWAGLVASATGITPTPLHSALWGAVAGYVSLWLVYWAFKLATGKEGMGYGDFKLFAALGAWFGWTLLVPIILLSSIAGAVVGIAMKYTVGLREGGVVPFGPFLAGAGLLAVLAGPHKLMTWTGL